MLACQTELFLIAHEIGHMVRRQLDVVINRVAATARSAGQPLDELFADMRDSDDEEDGADEIGTLLALGIFGRNGPTDEEIALQRYSGVEFGFQILRALEAIGVNFGSTHPRAYSRIDGVRRCVRAYCEGDPRITRRVQNLGFLTLLVLEHKLKEADPTISLVGIRQLDVWMLPGLSFAERMGRRAYWIDAIFSDAIDLIVGRVLFGERYNRAAARVIKRLDSLAESCIRRWPQPQEERQALAYFVSEAGPIVDKGYIPEILQWFCQVNEKAVQSSDDRRKLLLLVSFTCRHMNTAVRSIFLKNLGEVGYLGSLSRQDFSGLLTLRGCDALAVAG